MNGLVIGAMMALSMMQQTDTILDLEGAELLSIETMGGSIEVGVWDEDRIRIQAEHSNRTYIEIERRRRGREIDIEPEAARGPANIVDFRVTVPRTMSVKLDGQYTDLRVEGVEGGVEAETVQGEVYVVGGRGHIKVASVTGSIYVEGADGVIEAESPASDIHIVDSSGEIYAESAGGSIILEDVSPRAVDVGSTGGRVYYDGSFDPAGTYFFGAHGGPLTIVVGEEARASFNVATVHGSISSNLRGEAETFRGGERHEFEIGGGGAVVEAETFGGRIRLLRRGSEGAEAPVRRRRPVRDIADLGVAIPELAGRLSEELGPRVAAAWSEQVDGRIGRALGRTVARSVAAGLRGHDDDYRYDYSYEYSYDYAYDYDVDVEVECVSCGPLDEDARTPSATIRR
jgi:hypothetical protein